MKALLYSLWVLAAIWLLLPFLEGDLSAGFKTYTLPALLIANGCFVFLLFKTLRKHRPAILKFIKAHKWHLLALSLLLATVFGKMENRYRVLSDEANLLATAMNLYYHQSPMATLEGRFEHGQFHQTYEAMPKRPLQFSTIVFYLHSIFGYDFHHGFHLNNFLLVLLVFGLFALGVQMGGALVGWLAVLAVLAQPITLHLAFSAGFELFSLTLLCGLFCAIHFSQDKQRVITLWLVIGVMLCYARYEYALFAVILLGLGTALDPQAVWQYWRKNHIKVMFLALLIIPRFYQHLLTTERHNEMADPVLWSFRHIFPHLEEYWRAMLVEPRSPFNRYLTYTWIGIGCVIIWRFVVHPRPITRKVWWYGGTAILLASSMLVLYFGHLYGKSLHHISYRYFIGPATLLALVGTYAAAQLPRSWQKGVLGALTAAFILSAKVANEDPLGSTAILARTTNAVIERLDRELDPHGDSLLIVQRPVLYVVQERSALAFLYLKRSPGEVQKWMREGRYKKLLVMQELHRETKAPLRKSELPADFLPLRIVEEFPFASNSIMRISEYVPQIPTDGRSSLSH